MMVFRSFLKNPNQTIDKKYLVGGFKINERLLHYILVWILCPRATNHAQCTKAYLLILYGIVNNLHTDCPSLIIDTLLKAKRYVTYHLPYSLLISKICQYKGLKSYF